MLIFGLAAFLSVASSAYAQATATASSVDSTSKTVASDGDSSVTDLNAGEAPNDGLKALLERTKSQSHAYGSQVVTAVQSSPRLVAQLNNLVVAGKLSDIIVQRGNGLIGGSRFYRGAVVGTQIVMTEGLMQNIKPRPYATAPGHVADSTVFVLGHLAYHAQHDAELKAKNDAAAQDLFAHRNADGSVDATQFVIQSKNGSMDTEVRAFFQGWNDMVDAATLTKGSALTMTDVGGLLPNSTYGIYLARSMLQKGGSLKWDPSTGYLFATDSNLQTMAATLNNEPVADIQ